MVEESIELQQEESEKAGLVSSGSSSETVGSARWDMTEGPKRTILAAAVFGGIVVAVIGILLVATSSKGSDHIASEDQMMVASWNIAAINNNPFEYWVTHDDPGYQQLMQDIERTVVELTGGQRGVRAGGWCALPVVIGLAAPAGQLAVRVDPTA